MRFAIFLVLAIVPTPSHASAFPSLSCVFTEPFVGIDVWPSGASLFAPHGSQAATSRTLGGTILEPVLTAMFAGKELQLRIENSPGTDGMSDFERPLAGKLAGYQPLTLTGACLRYPNGTVPRPVIGVTHASRLTVRQSASQNGRVVGHIGSRGRFWAFPEPIVRGWARGAFERMPTGNTGRIQVAVGWVNTRFLGRFGSR